jgi:hypothetical protein
MALDPKKLQEAKRLLADLEKAYKTIGDTNPFKNISAANADLDQLKQGLKDANEYIALMDSDAADLVSSFKAITEEVGRTNKAYGSSAKSINSLTSLAGKLRDHQQGINTLSSSQLKTLQSKLKSEQANLKATQEILQGKVASGDATIKEAAMLANVNGLLEDNDSTLKSLEATTKKELKEREKIEKSIGVTGGLLRGMSKIPLIGDLVDTKEALEAAEETVKETGSGVRGMGAAFKTLGNQAASGLLNTSNMILGVFTLIGNIILGADKNAGQFAKSMNVTYKEALQTRSEMAQVAFQSGEAAVNSERLMETLSFVGAQLGTNAKLNEQDAVTFTKLREKAGLTNEELMGMQSISLSTGKSLESNTKEFLAQAKVTSLNNKVVLNEKKLLADISKISKATTLSLGQNPKELAKAVATAKSLGMEMSQLESSAESLLNFEQSIEDELSAELLLGKNLNLERARTAALNNDIAGLAEEINKQIGDSAEYSKMNRIQQDALAKSVGMNREELAQTLFTQEQLAGLSGEEAERKQALLDARIEEVGLAQAQRELENGSLEDLENQQSISERFNDQMLQLKEILVNGILPPFVAIGGFLAEHMGIVKTIVGAYLTLKTAMMTYNALQKASLGLARLRKAEEAATAAASISKGAFSSLGMIPVVGAVLAAAAVAAGVGLLFSNMGKAEKVKDAAIDPKGGLIVSGPKGTYQGDPEDTVMMGTGIGKGKGKPTPPPQGGGGGTVNVDMTQTNALLQQLINVIQSGGTVTLDGQKVGEALKLGSFQTQ